MVLQEQRPAQTPPVDGGLCVIVFILMSRGLPEELASKPTQSSPQDPAFFYTIFCWIFNTASLPTFPKKSLFSQILTHDGCSWKAVWPMWTTDFLLPLSMRMSINTLKRLYIFGCFYVSYCYQIDFYFYGSSWGHPIILKSSDGWTESGSVHF